MRNRRRSILLITTVSFLAVLLMLLLINEEREKREQAILIEQQYREEQKALREKFSFQIHDNPCQMRAGGISAYDVEYGDANGEILFSPDMLQADRSLIGANERTSILSQTVSYVTNEKDILVLQFIAYTEGGYAELQVQCGSEKNKVYINEIPTTFYVPISGVDSIDAIRFCLISDFVKTTLDSVYLVNYHDTYRIQDLVTGAYRDDEILEVQINAQDRIIDRSTQLLKKDDFLFAISIDQGTLTVYKEHPDGHIEYLSHVEDMGTIRDMTFSSDKNYLVVTARQNGVYFIDIANPTSIKCISHYDSLEYATGVFVQNDIAFICSRYFGVEIVDISDPYNPTFLNCVSSNGCEYQDCFVDENRLYIGVYLDKRVDIYDIQDLSNPVKMSEIALDGSGQGVYVKDGILYAATALDTPLSTGKLYQYAKGTGNGIEIYDVVDSNHPVHLSTVKTDGRLSINTNDVWDITVSNGYAFLSNMFGGVYVYDVTNPRNPVRKAKYDIVAPEGDSLFAMVDTDKYLLPYDGTKETRGCAYHTLLDDGYFYLIAANMGVYKVESEYSARIEDRIDNTSFEMSGSNADLPNLKGYQIEHYQSDASVWAVAATDTAYYLANGEKGVVILDKDLNLIGVFDTEYSVKDIAISNGYIYTAESEGGVGVYLLSDREIYEVGRFHVNSKKECITQIQLTGDQRYLLAEASINSYRLIDVSNPMKPIASSLAPEKEVGLMYYRALCRGVVANKYVGIAGSNNQYWYESTNDGLRLVSTIQNVLYSKSCGFAAAGDYCLSIFKNGYVYFDPLTGVFSERVKIEGISFDGKCSINDGLLVISTSYNGKVQFVDINQIKSPKMIAQFTIPGNPDVAAFDGDSILLPCRYYGLLKITKELGN